MEVERAAEPFASRVFLAITTEGEALEEGIDDATSRFDDLDWSYYVTRPFTWSRFMNWWVVRRWIEPRDVRRR